MNSRFNMSMVNPWVWVAAWMGVIFIFSTDHFSGAQTSRFIGPILKWIMPTISVESIANVQLFVRKTGHLAEYGILSILICRALAKRVAPGSLPLVALGQAAGSPERWFALCPVSVGRWLTGAVVVGWGRFSQAAQAK